MHQFRWLIVNNALDIVQPDMFYFGGMVRSMKLARMVEAFDKHCVPHISNSGLELDWLSIRNIYQNSCKSLKLWK